jgi:hypothetical protein
MIQSAISFYNFYNLELAKTGGAMTKKEFIKYLNDRIDELEQKRWETEDRTEETYLKGQIDAYRQILDVLKVY